MANSITNTNTRIATTIEDFFKELLKLLDQSDAFEKDSLFLGALKKDGNAPALVNVDTVIAKRLVHEMEKKQIPYMQFRIRTTGKDVLMVRPEDMPLIKDIENSIRIHAGLELDTKAELDRALALTDPSAKEYIIEGLNEYEADRIIDFAEKAKNPFVVVKEQTEDGKYLIVTHEKNTNSVNYYAAIAMFEASNTSKEMASIIEGEAYLSHQKKELEQAVDEIRVTNETRPAYVLSLTEPEKYIKISPTYFEYFDRGNAVHKMSLAQNPELYADALKLLGNSLPKPVFKLQTEINELGGINAALIDAKKHMPNGVVAKNYPMDTALKNWILEKTSPQSGFLYQNPDYVQKLNLNDFKISYLREHLSAAEEFEKKKPHYEKQVQVFYEKIQNLYRQTAHPMMNIDDTLMRCGYDPATIQEEFYDQKEVTEINSGKYQVEFNSEAEKKVEDPAKETKDFTDRQKEIIAARKEQTKER